MSRKARRVVSWMRKLGRHSLPTSVAFAMLLASLAGACGPADERAVKSADAGGTTSIEEALTLEPGRPGATDPGLSFAKWPDDELFAIRPPLTGGQSMEVSEPDLTYVYRSSPVPTLDAYAVATGRFITAEKDSSVRAYRNASGNLEITFNDLFGTPPSWWTPLMPRAAGATDFFDIAAADLDGAGASDADGNVDRHDELVVAHLQSADKAPQVTVIGFAPGYPPEPYLSAFAGTTAPALQTAYGAYNILSVTTGDFDGNSDMRVASGLGRVKEVAVAFLGSSNQLVVNAFRYTASWNPDLRTWQTSLTLLGSGSVTLADSKSTFESVSATAGDYDGDGVDELAVATSHQAGSNTSVDVRLFRLTGVVGKPMTFTQVLDVPVRAAATPAAPTRVQIASGLFTFDPDPAAGWGLLRRQLAVAYRYGGALYVQTIDLDATLSPVVSAPLTYAVDPGVTFAFAAGGFRGAYATPPAPGQSGDPTWSFALMTWQAPRYWGMSVLQPGQMLPAASKPAPFATAVMGPQLYTAEGPIPASRLALTAGDYDGNTVYLGAPMHLVVENFLSADYILEEPPKHTYWNRSTHKVSSVNRFDDFYLQLTIGDKRELTASRTDNVSYAVGGSVTAAASASVGAGANIGIASAKAEVKTEVSASLGYDYTHSESEMNSTFASLETQSIGATSRDDFILGRIRSFDVWRYRIYGLSNDAANPYAFFDFVLPAPARDETLPAGGASKDWYHPRHENGNILSYAPNDAAFASPPDLGEVAMDGVPVDSRIVRNASVDYGGTTVTNTVKYTDLRTEESSFSYNNAFKANASLKTTASAEASAFGVKTAASGSLAFEAHGNYSWGATGLHKTTTTKSSGLTLNVPTGNSQYAYTFHPMVYVTGDGTMKATYAVTIPLGGAWEQLYSGADLALNLPKRFIVELNDARVPVWVPYRLQDRKMMKGFSVRKEALNALTGEYDLIRPEVVPDTNMPLLVRVRANVYNYSIKGVVPASPVPAKACFHLIEMIEELNAPAHEKERPGPGNLIGCAYLPEIPPRGMVTAEVLWNTEGKSGGTTRDYRIYVRLDPDGVVAENYDNRPDWTETCGMYEFDNWYEPIVAEAGCVDVDPGQNNEGYFPVKVVTSVSAGGEGSKHAHVGFLKDAMAAVDRSGQVASGNVQAYVNDPLQYRVTVWSDAPTHATSMLLVYDGEPKRGGELIAMKEVFSGDPRGSSTWFTWTPTRIGAHRLYAKILQKLDDPSPGDNIGMLKVEVIPRPRRPTR